MALPYREFGAYFLRDLALTTKPSARDRVELDGNGISRQFLVPLRGDREPPQDFAARLAAFKKDLPRGSDQAYRLAISHEAFRRAGENNFGAAQLVFEQLKALSRASKVSRDYWGKRGITHNRIESNIGATHRGNRRKRKRPAPCADYRPIETIRSEVSRYKRKHANFDHAFENEFNLYRWIYCRDADLCAEEEAQIRELLNRSEAYLSPSHQLTATHTLNLARVLHEQRKFGEAIPVNWLALARCWAGSWAPHEGEVLISSIFRDIENCQNEQPAVFSLHAMLKSGHLRNYHFTVDLPAFGKASFEVSLLPKPQTKDG